MVPLVAGLLFVWLAGSTPGVSQSATSFPTGQLIESVASATSGQRFTLYVPTSYDPSRPAPILYLMDPRGRARVPAKLFQPVAERYGYILVSSHNTSSDVPMERNLRAMQAMWDDSHRWFQIDDRRVYIGGFSGTARTASLLARNLPGAITGVIGSGAGFHPDVRPDSASRTLYFITVGDADFNFHEVRSLELRLGVLDLPHRVETFAGAHSWMTPALAAQAVEWMELRAMHSGLRPRDEALLDAWWQRDADAARAATNSGRPVDSAARYAAMARDFAGLRDTAEIRALAQRIPSTPEAKAQVKRRQDETRRSAEWVRNAMEAIAGAFPPGADTPVLHVEELASALDLRRMKKTAAVPSSEAALESQRRLNQLEVQLGFYLAHDAIQSAELTRALYYLSLAVQIDDGLPVSWYLTAKTNARLSARRETFAALGRAVDAGFRDLAILEAEPAFRKYRDDPAYAAIVARLRHSGDTLDLPKVDRPPVLD